MAIIGVRSPYFISDSDTGVSYGTLDLTIDGLLRYSITKDVVPGTNTVTIDISQLVRDYIRPRYYTGVGPTVADSGEVTVTYSLNLFDEDDNPSAKNPIQPASTITAVDGYQYYYNGNNFVIADNAELVSGVRIWAPEGQSGFIYTSVAGAITKVNFSGSATSVSTININRFPCSRYGNTSLTFLNKFGVLQQMWFTAKTVTAQTITGSKYKSKYNAIQGGADGTRHQIVDFDRNGKKQYTLNTDYVSKNQDDLSIHFQELLQSEYVWLEEDGLGFSIPVNVLTSNVTYKTGLNDRLVNYQIVVEQAFDLISTAR